MAAHHAFVPGQQYTRKEIFQIVGIDDPGGGSWYTGYVAHGDDHFIFCGVGTGGRTGVDHKNYFDGDHLVWRAKAGSKKAHQSIQAMMAPIGSNYLFYRENDRDPFTFAGIAMPVSVVESTPVEVLWAFQAPGGHAVESLPEEISLSEKVIEGAKKTITVNSYERNLGARHKCLAHWGVRCTVCDFDFGEVYGELGGGFIHVHHLKPISEIGQEYELDPINDLRPVCPNCHAMLHREKPALSIEALREKLKN